MARNKDLSSETHQSVLVLRNQGYSMREIAKKRKISYNAVFYSLHRTAHPGSNQNRKRNGRPRCTTEQEDKYIRVSSLRNRHLTSPKMAALINSTRKTPVSNSTVKVSSSAVAKTIKHYEETGSHDRHRTATGKEDPELTLLKRISCHQGKGWLL
jgi:transposase